MKRAISTTIVFVLGCLLLFPSYTHASQDIYTSGNTIKKTLDNGMTVIVHEMHKTPIAAISLIVNTGSASEGKYSGSGISHLVEHMLFKDSADSKTKQRIRSIGGDLNGFTSHDHTGYTVTVSSEHAVEALEILKDILISPYFDLLELKKEKEVILDEIRRNKDDPARLALDLSWSIAFREHPYKYPVIGHEDLFMRLGKKEVEEYYSERYSPHNMTLAVSGDVKKEWLAGEANKIFGGVKRSFVPPIPSISEPAQLHQRYMVKHRPISLSHVVLSYKSASIAETGLYPLDILALALGEGEDSILTKKLRNKMRLVYNISCRNYTLQDHGIFYIYFTAENTNVDKAIGAVLRELENVAKNGISDADLKKSKVIARADLLNSLETAQSRARDLSISEVMTGDHSFSQIYVDKLQDVTVQNVKDAASAYLNRESANKVTVMPEENKKTSAAPDTQKDIERTITRETMSNGITVLVCEDRSMPLCSISALFLGGVRSEKENNNGISFLASKLLLDGTPKRSEEKIKSDIESIGGSLQSISGNNSFGISIDLFSADWKTGIEILSDIVQNPEFSTEKIEKEKTLMLAAIKMRDDSIIQAGLLAFKQNFFGDHPYRFDPLGTEGSVRNIDRDAIASHYSSLGRPGNMVLTVTGDVDAREVTLEIQRLLGKFKGTVPQLPAPASPDFLKQSKEISLSMDREQSLVIIGFPSVKLSDNDRYVFDVIDSIMSGLEGRMFTNIRDKLGMTYMIGSAFMPGLEPGSYIFYAAASAKNIETVTKAILKEIKGLKEKPIPDEELEAAKAALITSHLTGLQRNNAFGLRISLDELYKLGYDDFERYAARINSVTAGRVKRVVAQYFDTDHRLIVSVYGKRKAL